MAINENMIHCPFLSITKSTSASHKKNHVFFQIIICGNTFVENFPCMN